MLFGLGVVSFPVTCSLFPRSFDRGYAFGKVIGILSVSYLVWLLGSLRLLSFSLLNILILISIFILLNLYLLKKHTHHLIGAVKSSWKIFLFEELLFLIALISWSFVRGFQPDIRGLEKFMDFGFVNSILRSQYFPPQDMWFAGESINYYYFGHLITAVLTKLSGIPSHITYNLMMATLFALTFTGAFSLVATLASFVSKRKIVPFVAGILAALILSLGGNLHTLYWLITKRGFAGYWYPDATRFIVQQFGAADNTIHEFPIYSFVVADLHGHLINLPSVLLFLALLLTMFVQKKATWLNCLIAAWLLGIFYMTNAWDLPVYFLVFGLVVLYLNWKKTGFSGKTFYGSFIMVLAVLIGGFLFSLPFHLSFDNISKGIGFVDFNSPLWMLPVLWGLPLVCTFVFLIFLGVQEEKPLDADFFVLILLLVSWFLIILPEFIYVKDIYIHEYQRANTMFKFTYQSFVMFSIALGYIVARLGAYEAFKKSFKGRTIQVVLLLPILTLSIPVLVYPYFAIKAYYSLALYKGLSGETWLGNIYPGEYGALLWFRENVKDQKVILEASGDSYTDYNFISSYSGLQTVQGWLVHEWLWRGAYAEPGARSADVEKIYISSEITEIQRLLEKYNVKYVVVGEREKEKYPKLQENNFKKLGRLVFSSSGTSIYEI